MLKAKHAAGKEAHDAKREHKKIVKSEHMQKIFAKVTRLDSDSELRTQHPQDVALVVKMNHDRSPVTSIKFFVEKSSSSITFSKN